MKVWIKNEFLHNEQVTIKEDPWAWVYGLGVLGFVFSLVAGAAFVVWR